MVWRRPGLGPRVYVSTGIHGDEPAGPVAVERLFAADLWPQGADLTVCPCLNPGGFQLNTRENPSGIDLNRDYLRPVSDEIRRHVAWLDCQPAFDLALCLHEDWEAQGFYLYELNPDGRPSLAGSMVSSVGAVCPIDDSTEIDGRPVAEPGIIRPEIDPATRTDWPEAFYLIRHKTRLSYTLETPSDWPLALRAEAMVRAVRAAISGI